MECRLQPHSITWALTLDEKEAVKTYWPPCRRTLGLRTRKVVTRLEARLEELERTEALALDQVGISATPEAL